MIKDAGYYCYNNKEEKELVYRYYKRKIKRIQEKIILFYDKIMIIDVGVDRRNFFCYNSARLEMTNLRDHNDERLFRFSRWQVVTITIGKFNFYCNYFV